MPATYIYINDSSSNTWQIGVSDAGILSASSTTAQSPATLYLNDFATNSTTWQLAITTSGDLETISQTYSSSNPAGITLISPSGYIWVLQVNSSGILETASFVPDDDFWSCGPAMGCDLNVTVWM